MVWPFSNELSDREESQPDPRSRAPLRSALAQQAVPERTQQVMRSAESGKSRKPYKITKPRERWSDEEHGRFLEAIDRCLIWPCVSFDLTNSCYIPRGLIVADLVATGRKLLPLLAQGVCHR